MTENDRACLARANNLLKEKLLRWLPEPGRYPTAIEGLMISRRHDAKKLENCIYKPLVAVVVQGSKRSVIGSEEYRYGENSCLSSGWTYQRKPRPRSIPGASVSCGNA